jgi:chaperonin cofactor prefoldin
MDISKLNDKIIDLETENRRLQDSQEKYKREISSLKAALS